MPLRIELTLELASTFPAANQILPKVSHHPTFFPSFALGDIWFSEPNFNNPQLGNYAFTAGVLHETGHALGLAHGHETQMVNHLDHTHTKPTLPDDLNSIEYS